MERESGRGLLEEPTHERVERLPDVLRHPRSLAELCLIGLFCLAVFYTLYFGRAFLIPVVLALLLDFVLRPLVRLLQRALIPEPLGAAIILLVFFGTAAWGLYTMSAPAAAWLARAPQSLNLVEHRLRDLQRPMQRVSETAERLARIGEPPSAAPDVEVQTTSLRASLLGGTRDFLVESAAVVALLYFLLASGDLFLRKLVRLLPTLNDKRRAVEIARETERHISVYLGTVTLINAGLGLAVAAALRLVGIPNALLWGLMAGLLNFVPYLGATVGIGILTMVSLLTFDRLGWALLGPALYLAIQVIEANFVTPVLLGRRFTLNPVVIFLCLAFWGFLWGVPGMLVAVPLLAIFKIVCDHVQPLTAVGEFLAK